MRSQAEIPNLGC